MAAVDYNKFSIGFLGDVDRVVRPGSDALVAATTLATVGMIIYMVERMKHDNIGTTGLCPPNEA